MHFTRSVQGLTPVAVVGVAVAVVGVGMSENPMFVSPNNELDGIEIFL